MMPLLDAALALAAFIGHFALAVWLFNRLHALPLPVRLIKVTDKLIVLAAAAVCCVFLWRWAATGHALVPWQSAGEPPADRWLWLGYALLCWAVAIAVLPVWLIPKLRERVPAALLKSEARTIDVAERLGRQPIHGLKTNILARIPGNQFLRIAVERKTVRLERLPRALDGLTIAHLSDLHMTGHLGPEFFELVVTETSALEPDLIVITGDILERERCLPWGPPILSRLRARYGVYFIFGNHEMRLSDPAGLRQSLITAGLTDLGSRCETLKIRGAEVLLAGNERPWFGASPPLPLSPSPPLSVSSSPCLRILLSHTPDHLPWARAHAFDLMLAGHNHGGQIRLPYLGALISPSHYGWRYAGGLYHEPPTLLHVSRGVAGDHCLRLNCPPELALLTLTSHQPSPAPPPKSA
jgi:predicted MPP superfamily phosphohydrolase